MKQVRIISIINCLIIFVLFTMQSFGQNNKAIKDQLSVPGPIVILKLSYSLAWTSHPSATFYKQEYICPSDNIEKYKSMCLIDVLLGDAKAADLAKAKMDELKQLKQTNPIVNFEAFQKNGEVIIDFLISDNSADGSKVNIIERNVYRYRNFIDKNGKKGVMLFGVSERAYGNDVTSFLANLKKRKSDLTNAVAAYTIPDVTIN
jgi:hypothetical protein